MDFRDLSSRRDFLKELGSLGALASLTFWAGGCESCANQIKNRPTRRNIQSLSPSDPIITTYKNAVTAMRGLPSSDPRSWENQAQLHLNKCIHRNWLWLPWHRVYLLYLERICRKLTGDDHFALPYWNWTTHPAVPDVFWDTSSPLYDMNRAITQSDQADPSYIGATVMQNILNETNFELFASGPPPTSDLHAGPDATGMLEGTPHNNIHGFVGGDMGTFISPRDPVFYTHHNMLDCLWTHWNIDLNNANTNDSSWTNFSITDFVDENGNPVKVPAAVTVLFPIFDYQFEPCSFTTTQGGQKLQGKQLEAFLRAGAPSKIQFGPRFEVRRSITTEVGKPTTTPINVESATLTQALEGGAHTRLVLTIGEAQMPPKRDFYVRVFLNKPDVSAQTPIDDPHYAGSFGFFFDENAHGHHEGTGQMPAAPLTGFLVDVSATLRELNRAGSLTNQMQVSLVPVPFTKREAGGEQLVIGHLELAVARF